MATRRKKKRKNQGKSQKGSETMIMGIDHGYYAIKTRHFSFPAGVTAYITNRFIRRGNPMVSVAYRYPNSASWTVT